MSGGPKNPHSGSSGASSFLANPMGPAKALPAMRLLLVAIIVLATLSSCVNSTGVLPLGRDTYTITTESELGPGSAQKAAIKQAGSYAEERGMQVVPLTHDRGFSGTFNTYTLTFRLVSEDDPEWQRQDWQTRPDTVIEDARGVESGWEARLLKLQELRESGALTEEEFATLKASLLEKASH